MFGDFFKTYLHTVETVFKGKLHKIRCSFLKGLEKREDKREERRKTGEEECSALQAGLSSSQKVRSVWCYTHTHTKPVAYTTKYFLSTVDVWTVITSDGLLL